MKNLIFLFVFLLAYNPNYAQEGKYADLNGVKIYYEIHGDGAPLVLLHGFTMSHEMWDPFVKDLSEKYKLILIDLRGHGHSTNPSKKFTHSQSARDVYALMDLLEINTFKGMGFSSGGMTLTHMATMDSTRIEAMILIGSTPYFSESARTIQRSVDYESLDEEWMAMLQKWHPRGESQRKMLIDQFKNFASTYDDMNFTPPYLSMIKTPTLIIHGDRDPLIPVDIPVTSYKSIPNSYLWIVPNFGHSGFDNVPLWSETYLNVVKQFFSGDWGE